jgi:hypothetical protein
MRTDSELDPFGIAEILGINLEPYVTHEWHRANAINPSTDNVNCRYLAGQSINHKIKQKNALSGKPYFGTSTPSMQT